MREIANPSEPDYQDIPEVAQIDELQTPVGKKNNKIWVGTVVNKSFPRILAFVLGSRSSETFKPLSKIIRGWECFFYVTDGYVVDPQFINQGDRIVSKTYMTRA